MAFQHCFFREVCGCDMVKCQNVKRVWTPVPGMISNITCGQRLEKLPCLKRDCPFFLGRVKLLEQSLGLWELERGAECAVLSITATPTSSLILLKRRCIWGELIISAFLIHLCHKAWKWHKRYDYRNPAALFTRSKKARWHVFAGSSGKFNNK